MSECHQQAMSYVYRQVLKKLTTCFSKSQRAALQLLVQRLRVAAGDTPDLSTYTLLLTCSGGKDSLQTLIFLRAAQLSIAERIGSTFILRVATCRYAGLTQAALGNIERACDALFLHDDPRVQMLMVDECQVLPLDTRQSLSAGAMSAHRLNMLMSGHLTAGDERVTFGNSGYLSMAEFYQRAMAWQGGVDAVAVAESPREVRHYLAWGLRAARERGAGAPLSGGTGPLEWLEAFEELRESYYRELHGGRQGGNESDPVIGCTAPVHFIALHGLLDGNHPGHWQLLMDLVNYEFMGQGSGIGDFDCISPLLMAHMQGLRAEFLTIRDYRSGVHDYLRMAVPLMRSKGMPESLVRRHLALWGDQSHLDERRAVANQQARQAFDVEETHLICLLFAPFVEHGNGLKLYLQRCHPGMLVALPGLHGVLQGHPGAETLKRWLISVSGLPLVAVQRLYRMQRIDLKGDRSLLACLQGKGCSKARARAPQSVSGRSIDNLISGCQ